VQQWARCLNERRAGCTGELAHWQRECADESSARLPCDLAGANATIATIEHVRSSLEAESTEAIRRLVAEWEVSVEVALLAALATAVTSEAGGESLVVYVEHHGRDRVELDLSRTVGWGTVVFPLRVAVAASRRMSETIALVDAHLREIPSGGIGYGLLRFGSDDPAIAEGLSGLPSPQVSFNYLGCTDRSVRAGWRLARESCGREFGRGGCRPTILDVTGYVTNGALHVDWAYGSTLHRPATIERLANRCLDCLREWVAAERGVRRRSEPCAEGAA
jgi:non-ribosomal peptide synthase protein (TIGR01720 family)